jgi:serine protease inhibitor
MVLVVPQYIGGLQGIEDKITPDVIDDLVKNLDRSGEDEVLVKMPKFELEVGMNLKDTLEKCGLTVCQNLKFPMASYLSSEFSTQK